jgi:NADPH:quinone reductase-like Zn-dependent oxidoreductase
MKGILVKKFGGPEVLAYRDLDDPQPQANQIHIRVHSVGVNFYFIRFNAEPALNHSTCAWL